MTSHHRFWASLNRPNGELAEHDRPLTTTDDFIVLPSIGALLPFWSLIVARPAAINLRSLDPEVRHKILAHGKLLIAKLSQRFAHAFFFEHGAPHPGSLIGCGVDHAHLHVVASNSLSLDALVSAANLAWSRSPPPSPGRGYYFAGNNQAEFYADAAREESQLLRKVVAQLIEEPAWDYRTALHLDNVRNTIAEHALITA